MVKKESVEDMRELLNQSIKKNSKAEIFKFSQILDRHITEYLSNNNNSHNNVKIEKI